MNGRRSSLLPAFLPLLVSVAALAGFFVGYIRGRPGSDADIDKVAVALDRIQNRYYGDTDPGVVLDGALEGMVAKIGDPYSQYFTVQEYKEFNDVQLKGQFGGVGILIALDRETGYLNVETPIEGSPAFAADILPGDKIIEVNAVSIKGQTLQEIVRKIKGEPGTDVILTVLRKGKDPFQVTLTRAIIQIKAVRSQMLENGIGYIRISDFTEMIDSFDAEVAKLQAQDMKALVIDLRFNGGGLLHQCVELSDRFLKEGVIVTTRGRTDADTRNYSAEGDGTLPDLPLVVLINEATASASEIFAGAMKDHGRGALVGARSFGKGSVQTPFALPDGSHLKLTTARYFTPNGISVHREKGKKEYGLDPDFRIEMSAEEYTRLMQKWNNDRIVKGERPPDPEGFKDYQLEAALEVLHAKLEDRKPGVKERILPKEEGEKVAEE